MNSIQHTDVSFYRFVFKDRSNRRYLWIALVGMVVQFVIFKFLYPYPDFFSDSYSYIYAAYAHLDINIWPIGYSKFLSVFHRITHSDTALVAFQYFFLELTLLGFFFSVNYFFNPSRNISVILFIFLFFNPLFLYLTNYVNSDPLFLSLSILWFTSLIWILYRPRNYQIFVQAILVFMCFTVRNNAYYYPFISIITFFLSRHTFLKKLAGSTLGIVLIIPFIIHSRNEAHKITGTYEFSLFTGWQLANNALYVYDKIELDSTKLSSSETKELDQITRKFYNRVNLQFHDFLASYIGCFFIREPVSPLKQYFKAHYAITDDYSIILAWGKVSPVFEAYGKEIIINHPMAFAKYYLLPNAKNYFIPPLEKLEIYNLGMDKIWPIAKYWFHYKNTGVRSVSKSAQGTLFFFYPAFFLLMNIFFLGSSLWFVLKKVYKKVKMSYNKWIFMASSVLVVNFCFSVVSTIVVFRYQIFPMVVCFTVGALQIELLLKTQNLNQIDLGKKKLVEVI